jgi:hypothetical protein
MLVNFRTKDMNELVSSSATWLPDNIVIKCKDKAEPASSQPFWGGWDIASFGDITVQTVVRPNDLAGYIVCNGYLVGIRCG